jgi:hypothetical protein
MKKVRTGIMILAMVMFASVSITNADQTSDGKDIDGSPC